MLRKLFILTVSICISLTGCDMSYKAKPPAASSPDPLVGKWQDASGKTWEYFSDGTVMLFENGKEFNLIGNWYRVDDDRVVVAYTVMGNSVGDVFTEEGSGDEISMTDSKGEVLELKRAR